MIEWPDELIQAIASRKCVLFIGSGISANSVDSEGNHPPTWSAFLKKAMAKYESRFSPKKAYIDSLLDKEDYLTACDIIFDTIGEQKFSDFVEEEFRRKVYMPAKIHEAIYDLDSKIVLTPNVDKIYENYVGSVAEHSFVVKSYYEEDIAKYLRTEDYLIIRFHGYVDGSTKVVFTHKQYAEARCRYASFYKILDALILTRTFVFLGCGINDPDIQMILENSNFNFPNCRPHFFVSTKKNIPEALKDSLQKNRNIEILTYENKDSTHKELLDSLLDLNDKVEAKRAEIAMRNSW